MLHAPLQMGLLPPGVGQPGGLRQLGGARAPPSAPLRVPRDTKPATLHREESVLVVQELIKTEPLALARPSAGAGRLGSYCFPWGGRFFIS